jgi:molecular chaperone HtpG
MTDATNTPIAFKAEIQQLLDILIHSLYKEREIFIRELLSNASDALNRQRFEMLTNTDVLDPEAELKIHLALDRDAKTITISDTGIGMTADEMVENLGTIAHSGAKAFIKATKNTDEQQNIADIIGQFGVGFYSVFMAADWVRVNSRSYQKDASPAVWYATGEGTYTIDTGDKAERGTSIEIKLNDEAFEEFGEEFKLREIVKRHSNYVEFPIYVGDDEEAVNQRTALWRESPRNIDEDKYNDFYRQLTLDFEPPLKHIHMVVDAPIRLYALLYLPTKAERNMFSLRKEDGLKLYSRKVLIQEYTTDLLPEYYRFVHGVVDAEDLPLNVSRETVQSNALMAKLKKILTSRVTSTLKGMAKDTENPDLYKGFWKEFGVFLKQGIATDESDRESLYPLLRFATTKATDNWASLNDYVGRMKPGQKKIYFLLGEDVASAKSSPHLDYFNKHGYEVILFTEAIDSFMLLGLTEYEGFALQNVAAADLELPEADKDVAEEESPAEKMSDEAFADLVERFKAQLGERVTDVRATDRLSGSMARLVDPEGSMNQEMQRVYKLLEKEYDIPKKVLELNPKHPTLTKLNGLPADSPLAQTIIEQVYDSALLIEGLHPNPAGMLPRIQKLIDAALG